MNILFGLIFIPFFVLILVIVVFVIMALFTTKDYNSEDYFDL